MDTGPAGDSIRARAIVCSEKIGFTLLDLLKLVFSLSLFSSAILILFMLALLTSSYYGDDIEKFHKGMDVAMKRHKAQF